VSLGVGQQQGQQSSPSHQQMHYLQQQQQQQQQQQSPVMGAYGGTGLVYSQPQHATTQGAGARRSHDDKVSIEWVVSQTPTWRRMVRAQIELHSATTRRAEEQQRQQQMQAQQAWQRQQEQRQRAQLQQLRQEAAVRQKKIEVVREQHRKKFSALQAQLNAQAQEVQRDIEARRPAQKFVTRKRGVTELMKAYGEHIRAKRQRPLGNESKPDASWSAEELQLLHQLAASATSRDWSAIAARLPGRTAERCCERWAESFAPSIEVVAPPHDGDKVAVDVTHAVNECRIIVEDLALRWRDAISFMTPADAQKVDQMWQVYETIDTDRGAPKQKSKSGLEHHVHPAADDEQAEARSIMLGAGFKGFAPRVAPRPHASEGAKPGETQEETDREQAEYNGAREQPREKEEEQAKGGSQGMPAEKVEGTIVDAQRTYVRVQTGDPDGVGVAPVERYRALHAVYHPAGSPHVLFSSKF
jgi:hypothetical protein